MASSRSSSHIGTGLISQKEYDVLVSFRGEDTRNNFISHLRQAFIQKNIEAFFDDQLIKGDEISQSLLDAIETSTISIIIFSERYASSKWCLNELLKILECKHNYEQIVIPVFCHVDPSNVRHQKGIFGDLFSNLQGKPDKMQRWRNALTEAANLSGFDSRVVSLESKLIDEITNEVLKRIDYTFQSENKDLVGVESRIEEIESLLSNWSIGVFKLGIWGIGGIGKTTIAGVVFDNISRHFEGSYFAQNVREEIETGRNDHLRLEIYRTLLKDVNVENIPATGHNFRRKRRSRKKVLIVFDDVNDIDQIEFLIGSLDSFALGSLIIITTRDKHVLENCGVDQIYQMEELVHADAHKLFCQCAFKGGHLNESYTELAHKAIEYAKGVSLALKVLGRFLFERTREEWESAIRKLEVVPHMEIQNVKK